jgi:hypothetical protein
MLKITWSSRLNSVLTSRTLKMGAACLLVGALTACGGGSDSGSVGGALTSASTTAVPGNQVGTNGQAKIARPNDLPTSSSNKAMQRLAKVRCEKRRDMFDVHDKKGNVKVRELRTRCDARTEAAG